MAVIILIKNYLKFIPKIIGYFSFLNKNTALCAYKNIQKSKIIFCFYPNECSNCIGGQNKIIIKWVQRYDFFCIYANYNVKTY